MPPLLSDCEAADLDSCRVKLRDGSRSFHAAARLLPRTIRDPATALYAFCREADDVIDRTGVTETVAATALRNTSLRPGDRMPGTVGGSLDWLRERLSLAYDGRPMAMPADRAFACVVERFAIPRALPEALLEGFAWDAEGRRYQDLAALSAYAVRVAGTVGAMMAILMGVRDARRLTAAIDLGVAMQLSNVARDVGEDARAGRLYLPLAWLAEEAIDPDGFLAAPRHSPALGRIVRRLLDAADDHYQRAEAGIARLPLGCRFGIGAARLLYAEIGQEVRRRGLDSVSSRAVVSRRRKAWVLASGLGVSALLRPLMLRRPTESLMPDGRILVEAVVQTSPRPVAGEISAPWWAVADRMLWMIDLFARLEQRERVRT